MRIDELNLPVRVRAALDNEGIRTVEFLTQHTIDELKQARNIGEKSIACIVEELKRHRLQLAIPQDRPDRIFSTSRFAEGKMEDEEKRKLCVTAIEVLAGQLRIEPEALAKMILDAIAKPWHRIVIMSSLFSVERK